MDPELLNDLPVGVQVQGDPVGDLDAAVEVRVVGVDPAVDHRDPHTGSVGATPGPLGCQLAEADDLGQLHDR